MTLTGHSPIYSYDNGKRVIMLDTDGECEHVLFARSMEAYSAGFAPALPKDPEGYSAECVIEKIAEFLAQKDVGQSIRIAGNFAHHTIKKMVANDLRLSNMVKVCTYGPKTIEAKITRQYAPSKQSTTTLSPAPSDLKKSAITLPGRNNPEQTTNVDKLLEERGKTHGDFGEQSIMFQEMKKCCEQGLKSLPPEQRTAMEMIMLKQVRILTGGNACVDSWDDIGGYAKLGAKYAPDKGDKKD